MDIVTHMKHTNKPGLIVTIDFEKCFDRVEYDSIRGAFRYLGFGDNFISMMFLLFNNLEMCTSCNGYTSEFFTKTRGVNQGCPGSPLIYSFCGEIMSRLIMENQQIRGITINGIENILSQFADDTAAFLQYSDLVLSEFERTLGTVEQQMGLKISYEKTTIYRIGSLLDSNAQLYTQKNLQWSNDSIQLLGTAIACDGSEDGSNWNDIIEKVRKTCNKWANRRATLTGKILILNALIGSLFVYKMSIMCNLSENRIVQIERMIHDFIWSGKKPKISLDMLKKSKFDGGLGLFDLRAKQDALKISWIFRETDQFIKSCLYNSLCSKMGDLIWKCNLRTDHVQKVFVNNEFWTQVLGSWSKLNFKDACKITSRNAIRDQILWYNSNIVCDNKPIFWNHWMEKNILVVGDLLNVRGELKTSEELGGTG